MVLYSKLEEEGNLAQTESGKCVGRNERGNSTPLFTIVTAASSPRLAQVH